MTKWLEPDLGNILDDLKQLPNFVLAKPILREGKFAKVPFQPNGRMASVADPRTWSSFAAVAERHRQGGYPFVGFVLDGKPHFGGLYLHGFDWDHCIENGIMDAQVRLMLDKLSLPRAEISVSGTGIRGFFLLEKMLPNRKVQYLGRSVEMYSNKRYMTTTGIETKCLGQL